MKGLACIDTRPAGPHDSKLGGPLNRVPGRHLVIRGEYPNRTITPISSSGCSLPYDNLSLWDSRQ